MSQRDRESGTSTTTTTAAPSRASRRNQAAGSTVAQAFALGIPADLNDQVESVEIEFVHDGKGGFSVPSVSGFSGARVTERIQEAAPPHAIVVVRPKRPERDENTRVRQEARTLDFTGSELTFTANGIAGLRLNERNSIPLVGRLPAGDAPKAVSEGVVATG
jgi:hypothetical protein